MRESILEKIVKARENAPRKTTDEELKAKIAGLPPCRDFAAAFNSNAATQKVMGRFFDSETTVLLDAMIEGLTLHRALGGEPRNPQSIRDGIRRIIDHRR